MSTGDVSLGSTLSATSGVINIGGIPFLHGYAKGNQNVFVGGAGNFTTTGTATAATGFGALAAQTTGSFNTASGLDALFQNTTGSHNAANGYKALFSNTTGSDNTASGRDALENNVTGGLNTAVGYLAGPGSGSPRPDQLHRPGRQRHCQPEQHARPRPDNGRQPGRELRECRHRHAYSAVDL